MHKHSDPCPFTAGCPGRLLVSRSERVPGVADYNAACNTCGCVDGWTEPVPVFRKWKLNEPGEYVGGQFLKNLQAEGIKVETSIDGGKTWTTNHPEDGDGGGTATADVPRPNNPPNFPAAAGPDSTTGSSSGRRLLPKLDP